MGLDLKNIVEIKKMPKDFLRKKSDKKIAVDALYLIHTFLFTFRDKEGFPFTNESNTLVTSHIYGLLRYLKYSQLPVENLIFVFDGRAPEQKREELEKRNVRREEVRRKLEEAIEKQNQEKIIAYRRLFIESTQNLILEMKELLKALGIQYIQAKSESDFAISRLYKEGIIWSAISNDRDLLLHGIPFLLDPMKKTYISLEDTLNSLSWSQQQFITFGVLLGTDYPGKAKGFGIITGKKLISKTDPSNPFETIPLTKGVEFPNKVEFYNTYELFEKGHEYEYLYISSSKKDMVKLIELTELYSIKSPNLLQFIDTL